MISGITLIRNGNKLQYPWKECVLSMASYCDQVLVNIGDSDDNTWEDAQEFPSNVQCIPFKWNMENTGDGRELALQANNLLPYVTQPWVMYLQADEFVLENHAKHLRNLIDKLPNGISQVELLRTYFWGSLTKRAPKFEIWLGRLFRANTHTVGGDGMYLIRNAGDVYRSVFWIYHYSRIGTPEEVTKRVRTLDMLFHPEDEVKRYAPFDYSELKKSELIDYNGIHPNGIKEYYE